MQTSLHFTAPVESGFVAPWSLTVSPAPLYDKGKGNTDGHFRLEGKCECPREDPGWHGKNTDGTLCAEKNMYTPSTKADFYTASKSLPINVKKGLYYHNLAYLTE